MKKHVVVLLSLFCLLGLVATECPAEKIFGTVWLEKYVPEEPATVAEEDWQSAAKKARCYVCHVKSKSKKYCNTYGDVLAEWLKSEDFEKDRIEADEEQVRSEILTALDNAESQLDTCGSTFDDLFRKCKLPSMEMGVKSVEKGKAAAEDDASDA